MAMANFLKDTNFNQNRTFGVEIEFFGVSYHKVVSALREKGVSVHHEHYNHSTRRHWKLVYDISVTSRGTEQRGGNELVSPILKGKRGLQELKLVLDTLDEIGAKVDRTCGLHVHHAANDFTVGNFKNAYAMYYKFENFFDAVVAPSRRESVNQYCRGISKEQIEALAEARNVYEVGQVFSSRYCKLNVQAFFRHGTLEFRQHGGTVNSDKAVNWVIFTQAIMERAKGEAVRVAKGDHDRGAVDNFNHERRLRRTLFGAVTKETLENELGQAFKFQMARRKHFESRVA